MYADLDLALATIPYFRRLRPDERARVADLARTFELAKGAAYALTPDGAVVLVTLSGEVEVTREGAGSLCLEAGDWTDDLRAVSGRGRRGKVTALEDSRLAMLDQAALDHLFAEVPFVAVALLGQLGREAQARNDLLRDLALARASGLPPLAFQALVLRRRRRMQQHDQASLARVGGLLWRALVLEPSRRLAFWIFLGAASALVVARSVVAAIISGGLQKNLFALIESGMGHPVHVHHFNYGLVLVALVGLLSLIPKTRRLLRLLAFAFGFGVGLVVDEFALFWNLNPDYYQASSLLAASAVLFALFQAVYFRPLYLAVGRRLFSWIRP